MESPDFKEGNVSDLVLLIILPVIDDTQVIKLHPEAARRDRYLKQGPDHLSRHQGYRYRHVHVDIRRMNIPIMVAARQ